MNVLTYRKIVVALLQMKYMIHATWALEPEFRIFPILFNRHNFSRTDHHLWAITYRLNDNHYHTTILRGFHGHMCEALRYFKEVYFDIDPSNIRGIFKVHYNQK